VKRHLNGELTLENVKKMDSKEEEEKDKNILLHKLKSYKTNSTVSVLQGMSVK